jgi:chromate reductase
MTIMAKFKIAIVVGSNRRESLNRKLAHALGKLGADKFDVTFPRIDDLPLFNQDHENDLPASVARFKADVNAADGVLIVTPEHNRSIPAALKNAIDWGARPYGTSVWGGKAIAITGTSPGAIGTAVAQQHLRTILGAFLGALVMGGEAYVTFKPDLIDANGNIADAGTRTFLQGFLDQFATLLGRLAPAQRAAA